MLLIIPAIVSAPAKISKIVFIPSREINLQKNGIQICVCHFFVVILQRKIKTTKI
jgi:hypothetical protein